MKIKSLPIAAALLLAIPACLAFQPARVSRLQLRASRASPTNYAAVRVITYNILAPRLCEPSFYPRNDPDDLKDGTRFKRVLGKLEAETTFAQRSIICLQEVSLSWAGPLHAWFAARGYHLICSSYGGRRSDYMGSAIAVPMDRFVLEAAHIERIADTRRWPRDRPVRPLRAFLARIAALPRRLLGRPATKEMQDPWKDAQYRHNQGILSELKCVVSGKQFAVATYHMPCAFYNPTVMVIHAALLLRWAQKHAHRKPLILCGDFNLKPSDAGYHLITGGPTAEVPPAWDGTAFDGSTAYNCKSVFKEVTGKEPDFTNWAHTRRDDEPFIACLDYIFCSPSILVDGVVLLEGRATTATPGPYPTRAEPSDHVMLACDLRIPFVASESVLGKPITRNQDVENLEQYLLEFLADSSKERLDLDASLTSFERLVVHQFCEKEGLGHQSLGQKPTRYISVTKQPHAKP